MSSKLRFGIFSRDKGSRGDHKESKGKKGSHQRAAVPSSPPSSKNTTTIPATAGSADESTEVPQSREQVAIGTTTSPVSRPNDIAILTPPLPTTAVNPAATTSPIEPEQLWDRAYDDLKAHESKLVLAYEKVLSREFDKAAPNSVPLESQINTIEQIEPTIRRSQMQQLAQAGLKKTEAEAKVKQNIGNAMHVVLSAKDIVSFAVQACPQAALAWTGVCFALQILLNPTDESKANREGIIYVTSRMEWYWKLSDLLFEENKPQVDGGSFTGLQSELKNRIIDLYKTLLSYQMKSVCSYYRNRGVALLGDSIRLDDWNGSLKTVQDAETAVRNDSEVYRSTKVWKHLEELVNIARNHEMKLLGDIYAALQQQSSLQVEREDYREDNQCLKDLRARSTNPIDDMIRIEKTKGGLIEDSYVWILSHKDFIDWRDGDETRLLWIRGNPGKGKTMLLIGVIRELQKSIQPSSLLSYFFCQGTDSRLNNATAVLTGLMYQLLMQQRSLITHLREQYDKAGQQLFNDINAFVALSKIFTKMLEDTRLTKVYLIVDALDECDSGLLQLLDLIVPNASTTSSRVKWLVSSRNQPNIEERLTIKDSKVELDLELNAECVSGAVATYIDYKVSELKQTKGYDSNLSDQLRDQLHQKANDTFLWVAIVCQELGEVESWDVLQLLQEVPSDLKGLYVRVIKQIQQLKGRSVMFCMQVLSTMTLAYRPLHFLELAALADLPKEVSCEQQNLKKIVQMCNSFLIIRDSTIYFIHQSAKDFLSTCVEIFPSGQTEVQQRIVLRSLQSMDEKLHGDIYNLQKPGILIDQVNSINPDPLAQIRYACIYWVGHLGEVDRSLREKILHDDGEVHGFLEKHFLHWLEALSLMRNAGSGVVMIRKLRNLLAEGIDESRLLDLVRDELRFILHNRWVIENAPLQVYASALVFSPVRSLTRGHWKREEPAWIITKPTVESDWSPCLLTLEHNDKWPNSVVFSHDSRLLASGSQDRTVKIWDAETGECLKVLCGHRGFVKSVAFSGDSQLLASGSWDLTVKVWDTGTGECLKTLEGHIKGVWDVVFSHDSRLIASSGQDGMVKVWNAKTGECTRTIESHGESIRSVVFSHDSRRLVSASRNGKVEIWNTSTGVCLKSLVNETDIALSVAFSHDSRWLANSVCNKIKIWDAETYECLHNLEDYHSEFIPSVVFSHDSRLLASAGSDGTIKVWDVETGGCLRRLEGHGDVVESVTFSHDSVRLASGSRDGTVKVWDTTTKEVSQRPQRHRQSVTSVIFSHDSRSLASGSPDGTLKVWDARTGNCLRTFIGHKRAVLAVVFSHCSQRLASASLDGTVRVWNSVTSDCIHTLACSDEAWSVVFSHDSLLIASSCWDGSIRIWDALTGECKRILDSHRRYVTSVVFSHNSLHLVSSSWDGTVRIWYVRSGVCLHTLEGHKDSVDIATFSHDSRRVASGSSDGLVKIWDVESGECLKTLEGHHGPVTSLSFSHDSKYLSSASEDSSVKVWDEWTGECIKTLESHGRRVHSSVFAYDSSICEPVPDACQTIADPKNSNATAPMEQNVIEKAKWHGYSLNSDGSWIKWHTHNLLWLPSEYRASSFAVSGNVVAIGCGSGKVIIMQLSPAMMNHQS